MSAPHPYAHILRAVAEGENVQWQDSPGRWINQTATVTLQEIANNQYDPRRYRVHASTITINGREVREPLREMPPEGTSVYWPSFGPDADEDLTATCEVRYFPTLLPVLLRQGLLHSTHKGASDHAKALISFTEAK